MKERPILFSGPMVRALLDGSKTQTRRIVKQLDPNKGACTTALDGSPMLVCWAYGGPVLQCPYGKPGDRLWVREAFARSIVHQAGGAEWFVYRECDNRTDYGGPWKPSIFMPRAASRILLEIVSVRVERLNDCSELDAIAEGCSKNHNGYYWGGPHAVSGMKQMATARQAYRDLWESINGAGSWAVNPWVWVVEFKRVNPTGEIQ